MSGGGWSRAGEAGQEGSSGVADQRDPANRLRTDPSAIQLFCLGVLYDQLLCRENRLYFLIFLCVSHSASFVQHIVSAVLLKTIQNQKKTFLLCTIFCLKK